MQTKQWRIQGFILGYFPKVGVLTYYFAISLPKPTWKWKNFDPGGVPGAPLDSSMQKTLYLSCHLWYRSGRRPPYKLKLHVYRHADFCKAGGTKISKTTRGKSSQWCLSASHQNTLIHAKFSWMKEENHFNLKKLSSEFCDKFWCYILWQILMLHFVVNFDVTLNVKLFTL